MSAFATRAFAQRSSSALRQVTRKAAPIARRRYASKPVEIATKSSDLPWLIGSVVVTVTGVTYLTVGKGAEKLAAKHEEEVKAKIEERPKVYTGSDESAPPGEGKAENKTGPKGAADPFNPEKRSAIGQNVPPPDADNEDLAKKWEEKQQEKKEFDELIRKGETRVATSSSSAPSKRKAGEHPREDPKKGEGKAIQKGGPREDRED